MEWVHRTHGVDPVHLDVILPTTQEEELFSGRGVNFNLCRKHEEHLFPPWDLNSQGSNSFRNYDEDLFLITPFFFLHAVLQILSTMHKRSTNIYATSHARWFIIFASRAVVCRSLF